MKKIIIIDGNSLAYSRVPDNKKASNDEMYASSDGREIYIVRKFIRKLFRFKYVMYSDYHFVVVFDQQNKDTFRHRLDPKYKAKTLSEKRQKQKDYVYQQIEEIKRTLDKIGIPNYSCSNWEADDIIGMLTKKFEKKGYLTTIVTGDKDILQLISGKTRVKYMSPNHDDVLASRNNVWDVSGGAWPDQVIEIKMLAGDSSDNIKGLGLLRDGKVDYWSKEEATDHIKRWDSVDNMIKNIDKVKAPYNKSLIKGAEKLKLNRKLVTIVRDWDIPVDVSYFLEERVNAESVHEVIEDLNLQFLKKNKRFVKNIK